MAAVVVAGVVVVIWALARPEPTPELSAPLATRAFVVDGPGVLYEWTALERGPGAGQTVRTLDQIPPLHRTAVQIWSTERGTAPAQPGGYLIDLSQARPGQELEARWRGRGALRAASHAAASGRSHGKLTGFLASEIAAFDPRSDRRAAARRSARLLEALEDDIMTYERLERMVLQSAKQPPPAERSVPDEPEAPSHKEPDR